MVITSPSLVQPLPTPPNGLPNCSPRTLVKSETEIRACEKLNYLISYLESLSTASPLPAPSNMPGPLTPSEASSTLARASAARTKLLNRLSRRLTRSSHPTPLPQPPHVPQVRAVVHDSQLSLQREEWEFTRRSLVPGDTQYAVQNHVENKPKPQKPKSPSSTTIFQGVSRVNTKVDDPNWPAELDKQVIDIRKKYPDLNWADVGAKMDPKRTGRQVRDRYLNVIATHVNRGSWSAKEDRKLLYLHSVMGPRWSNIGKIMTGRGEMQVKNRYNTFRQRGKKEGKAINWEWAKNRYHYGAEPEGEVMYPEPIYGREDEGIIPDYVVKIPFGQYKGVGRGPMNTLEEAIALSVPEDNEEEDGGDYMDVEEEEEEGGEDEVPDEGVEEGGEKMEVEEAAQPADEAEGKPENDTVARSDSTPKQVDATGHENVNEVMKDEPGAASSSEPAAENKDDEGVKVDPEHCEYIPYLGGFLTPTNSTFVLNKVYPEHILSAAPIMTQAAYLAYSTHVLNDLPKPSRGTEAQVWIKPQTSYHSYDASAFSSVISTDPDSHLGICRVSTPTIDEALRNEVAYDNKQFRTAQLCRRVAARQFWMLLKLIDDSRTDQQKAHTAHGEAVIAVNSVNTANSILEDEKVRGRMWEEEARGMKWDSAGYRFVSASNLVHRYKTTWGNGSLVWIQAQEDDMKGRYRRCIKLDTWKLANGQPVYVYSDDPFEAWCSEIERYKEPNLDKRKFHKSQYGFVEVFAKDSKGMVEAEIVGWVMADGTRPKIFGNVASFGEAVSPKDTETMNVISVMLEKETNARMEIARPRVLSGFSGKLSLRKTKASATSSNETDLPTLIKNRNVRSERIDEVDYVLEQLNRIYQRYYENENCMNLCFSQGNWGGESGGRLGLLRLAPRVLRDEGGMSTVRTDHIFYDRAERQKRDRDAAMNISTNSGKRRGTVSSKNMSNLDKVMHSKSKTIKDRTNADGTIRSAYIPKYENGKYLKPKGRTMKGMLWDESRGVWAPDPQYF